MVKYLNLFRFAVLLCGTYELPTAAAATAASPPSTTAAAAAIQAVSTSPAVSATTKQLGLPVQESHTVSLPFQHIQGSAQLIFLLFYFYCTVYSVQ